MQGQLQCVKKPELGFYLLKPLKLYWARCVTRKKLVGKKARILIVTQGLAEKL